VLRVERILSVFVAGNDSCVLVVLLAWSDGFLSIGVLVIVACQVGVCSRWWHTWVSGWRLLDTAEVREASKCTAVGLSDGADRRAFVGELAIVPVVRTRRCLFLSCVLVEVVAHLDQRL